VTGNNSVRVVESSNINKSLFNLGKVIDALNEARCGSGTHVPYRDSKLTRLLQDSLGGGNRATMIINLPPTVTFFHHICNTLSFAAKSRSVVNCPVVQVVAKEKVESMQDKLARFKAEKEARRRSASVGSDCAGTPTRPAKKRKHVVPFGKENAESSSLKVEERAQKVLQEANVSSHVSADVMGLCSSQYLLTPGAKMKQAKRQVSLAQGFEADNCLNVALVHYEEANDLVPTSKLADKIQELQTRLHGGPCIEAAKGSPGSPPQPMQYWGSQYPQGLGGDIKDGVRSALEKGLLVILNSGLTERLSSLKDIGPKRVERIQELQTEGFTFETVADLGRIGMSEKQVATFVKKNAVSCL